MEYRQSSADLVGLYFNTAGTNCPSVVRLLGFSCLTAPVALNTASSMLKSNRARRGWRAGATTWSGGTCRLGGDGELGLGAVVGSVGAVVAGVVVGAARQVRREVRLVWS
ncbi:hypothetical protein Ae201684_017216 [Aphanomyces euteiches]|uniref:Uncharacterized protein n=1 Tax=Aphanomyces euteiches TaxID=100861 RepID=A0A6G0WAV1_9STRA|nr:hypothetical protein Ae201684_017216 [Aphanomyces euteiches]